MKVLITGGFGLIGSRLAKSLLEDNFQVLIGSRNITKFNGWMNELEVMQFPQDEYIDTFAFERIDTQH